MRFANRIFEPILSAEFVDHVQITAAETLGIGDRGERGVNRFAHAGMVKRVIGGHWVWSPRMQEMARTGQIEAYVMPSGVTPFQPRRPTVKATYDQLIMGAAAPSSAWAARPIR